MSVQKNKRTRDMHMHIMVRGGRDGALEMARLHR